jgi:cytochrome P450
MVGAIDEVLDEWEPASRGEEPFNMAQGFARMTMNVLVRTMFGSGLEPGEPERVAKALAYAIDYTMMGLMTNSLPDWVPVPGRARYREALQTINALIFRIIQKGRQGGMADNSLLSMLLNMVDAETGAQMTDEQLRDEAVALFLAGYESTSVGLSWAYHAMTQQPELAQRLREEVDGVLGQRKPGFADLQLLPYTRNVFQEALRLYPPAWFAPRMVEEDDEIDGYRIPAGKTVAPITWMIQRHPDFWEDPARFDPDRFTPQRSEGRHKYAYTPFLIGKRQCIGKEFSMMEGVFMLARISQRYQASAVPGRVAQLHIATTIRTKDGVWVNLKPR